MLNIENAVLAEEKSNVSTKVEGVIKNNLLGQVDTITLSLTSLYEQSKIENIKAELRTEITTFKQTINKMYEASDSHDEAKLNILPSLIITSGAMAVISLPLMPILL
jgi:methyl-accepting chemotaxis protein